VVFSPINPELDNYKLPYHTLLDSFVLAQKIPNIKFINLSHLLEKEDFVDHFHPSASGARKITLELAKILNECSSKQ
jgi:lysophospholipase L1-like esterase